MKKILFLLGGVLMLASCSEDVFEAADLQLQENGTEGSQYQTNSYTGGITVDGKDDGLYKSPWNIDSLRMVEYQHISNLSGKGVYVRITPYIGLAYYDGANNGNYNILGSNINLSNGNYPNLFANGNEYGNYVQGNPIVLANPLGSQNTHELYIKSREDHCPLSNIPITPNYNLFGIGFNILNNSIVQPQAVLGYPINPVPPAGTPFEEALLRQFGKVFYYKVEFGNNPYNFDPQFYYIPLLEAEVPGPEWSAIGFQDTFNTDLYYNSTGIGGGAGTYEIVVDPAVFQSNNNLQNVRSGQLIDTNVADSYGNKRRKITTLPTMYKYYPVWKNVNGVMIIVYYIVPGYEPRATQIRFE